MFDLSRSMQNVWGCEACVVLLPTFILYFSQKKNIQNVPTFETIEFNFREYEIQQQLFIDLFKAKTTMDSIF